MANVNQIMALGLARLLENAEKAKAEYLAPHVDTVIEIARQNHQTEDLVDQYVEGLISSTELIEKVIDKIG